MSSVAPPIPTQRPNQRQRKQRLVLERSLGKPRALMWRLAIIVSILLAWGFLPKIPFLVERFPFLDAFFISSPQEVFEALLGLVTGTNGRPLIWPYVRFSLTALAVGAGVGIITGCSAGLLLSNDRRLRQVFAPFIHALNSMPKIGLIPVIVIAFGPSLRSTILVGTMSVFFSVFFNAYEGGRGVPLEMLQNGRLMGASPIAMMYRIRGRYVVLWTFGALPNAISQGLLAVITAEVLSGAGGMGQLIVLSLSNLDASFTYALVVFLSIIGTVLVTLADRLRVRVLHWAPAGSL